MKRAILAANDFAQRHATSDPFKICRNEGVFVHRRELASMRGYYLKVYEGIPTIAVADDLPAAATMFVCAHELGHHIFDGGLNRMFMDSRTFMVPNKYENRADAFALTLLLNMAASTETPLTDWVLSECLNVPKCKLDTRLLELGVYN